MNMKTKFNMVTEIYNANKSHYFVQKKDDIINISIKYKDHQTISEVYNKVKQGIVPSNEALEYLSGFKSYPIYISAY